MSKIQPTVYIHLENLRTDFTYEELKSTFWEWYKHTVNGSFNTSTNREEREIITSVYERFVELIDSLYQKDCEDK